MPKDVSAPSEFTASNFYESYQSLCRGHGFQLGYIPQWIRTNHGTYEMVIKQVVIPLTKKSASDKL